MKNNLIWVHTLSESDKVQKTKDDSDLLALIFER